MPPTSPALPTPPARAHAHARRRAARTALALLPLLAALVACGTDDDTADRGTAASSTAAGSTAAGSTAASEAPSVPDGAGAAAVAASAERGTESGVDAGAPTGPTADPGQATTGAAGLARLAVGVRIAQTADVTLRVGKGRLDETLDAITLDAQRLGGYVASSGVGDVGRRAPVEGTIVIRVPARRFAAALKAVGARGTVLARTVGSEDVTQEYVDTQARLRHDRAVEGRLLTLLGRAERVGEVLAVQDRLSRVQEEIEISKGRAEQLAAMTELSTIAVHLREPGVVPPGRSPSDDGWGVRAALRDAAHNAVDVVNGGIVALGAILPVLVLAALVVPVGLRVHRRRRGGPAGGAPLPDAS